ncbi:MAG: WYL domain-containing transcriptional regulator [Chitinispirillaceae bacterium]|nr:WYL domain-containing transcriptional regulator [Chitinispirillaceae bacterium]
MSSMDKWEKVVQLHGLLDRSRYAVSLQTILDELECSEATFHRLRNYMKERMGAPIAFNTRYRGYHYDTTENRPFELPGLWFTQKELEALLYLDQAIETLQPGLYGNLFGPVRKRVERLLRQGRFANRDLHDRIKIIPIQSRPLDETLFRTIAHAVLRKKPLIIEHLKPSGSASTSRTVSPQALVRYRDNWYLDAWCHLRNELRTFALSRIIRATPIKTRFHRVPRRDLRAFFSGSYGIFTGTPDKIAVIEFTNDAATMVSAEQWHPDQNGEWVHDATYRLSIPYRHSPELVMDILRWGGDAEVLRPPELRTAVMRAITGMKKKYRM